MRTTTLFSLLALTWIPFAADATLRPTGTMGDLDQSVRECVMLKYTGREDGEAGPLSMRYEDINQIHFDFDRPGCRWTVTGQARVPARGGFHTQWWVCVNLDAGSGFISSFIADKRLDLN